MQQPTAGGAAGDLETKARASGAAGLAGEMNGAAAHAADELDMVALLDALQAMRMGDFSVRMPSNQIGLAGKVADAFNDIIAVNQRMAQELVVIGKVVGREG
jgi:hypothetical protein